MGEGLIVIKCWVVGTGRIKGMGENLRPTRVSVLWAGRLYRTARPWVGVWLWEATEPQPAEDGQGAV